MNNNVERAKELRKNMTKQERHLWYDFLKTYPIRFYRQRIIGPYIADFYCSKAKLIVELDGSQHFEDDGLRHDRIRTEYLESKGLLVVRIPNHEIDRNFSYICEYIDMIVNKRMD